MINATVINVVTCSHSPRLYFSDENAFLIHFAPLKSCSTIQHTRQGLDVSLRMTVSVSTKARNCPITPITPQTILAMQSIAIQSCPHSFLSNLISGLHKSNCPTFMNILTLLPKIVENLLAQLLLKGINDIDNKYTIVPLLNR